MSEQTSPHKDSLLLNPQKSRRSFLSKMIGTAAFTSATVFSTQQAQASFFARRLRPIFPQIPRLQLTINAYRIKSYTQRLNAAQSQLVSSQTPSVPNTDEATLPKYIGSFTKTLPKNALGEGDPAAFEQMIKAGETGSIADFAAIPRDPAAVRKLVNPQATWATAIVGQTPQSLNMPAAPAFSSAWEASEMGELYLHALLRDVDLNKYATDPKVVRALTQINAFSDFRGPKQSGQVTAGTLFRGETRGDLVGNYISQFLLLPIPFLGSSREQRYKVPAMANDHMTTVAAWLAVQRGAAPTSTASFDPTPRYLATARDLGEYVHFDFSYEAFLYATQILLGRRSPFNSGNPYPGYTNQDPFSTLGGPDILSLVAEAGVQGLRAAWHQKWSIHRRLRPEEFGGFVHHHKAGTKTYPINNELLNSTILNDVFTAQGTYLLSQVFPEGSPIHPAYPSGHATISGACVTVMKAFFNEAAVLANPVEVDPASNGTALRPYTGAALTVGGELDKLASNVSVGRNLAGVHWRTDATEGMLLGEKVAIALLKDHKRIYNENVGTFKFTGFKGNPIEI